ncbi:hypothetical protein [Pseudomonas protegens]|uniref:hypothetical protein n=2 Tax=Pseudomonas protegens TaxID=380021 RepID=UPI001B314821|nr:hypothetical protein [Pseudomonas protegens]MBP5099527.1 hypothetical protein [Pseudomonas protegens]MBP5100976.1 hypothetical protein [Pseudomonas protegens]MBP5126034.1 hypothetical protein [Pseudomonas protegens]QTU06284.1 hypothetical protein HUT25_11200 [Pseudomonas protegens]QTU12594.1 hypothetical protein HUT23_11890 [Pseudomonas protegens]
MNIRHAASVFFYIAIGALYVPLHDYLVDVYLSVYGELTSRGVNIGMTNELMFQLFVLVNLIVLFVRNIRFKLVAVLLMTSLIVFCFLSRYPVRAMAYCVLGGALSIAAIVLRAALERLFSTIATSTQT